MAVDTITLTDGNGVEYSLIVDKIGTDRVEVLKAAFGAEEVTPTLVSAANPMPTVDAAVLAAVDGLEGFTDGVEALLTTISTRAAADQVVTLTDGRKTVAVAGTAEAIRASLACKWVAVTALKTNTTQVNVGGSGVLATVGGSTGTPLGPGDAITLPVDNASKVFVDARTSGEGVSFTVGS